MHIYFSGIGGAGLSPLAMLSLDCGFGVSGSDRQASLGTQELESRGVTVNIGQNQEEIESLHRRQSIDWLVFSSAIPDDHPHLEFAQKNGIKVSKRHELINHILEKKKLKAHRCIRHSWQNNNHSHVGLDF